MDGQNYNPQDHASMAASRGKNDSKSVMESRSTYYVLQANFTVCCETKIRFMPAHCLLLQYSGQLETPSAARILCVGTCENRILCPVEAQLYIPQYSEYI